MIKLNRTTEYGLIALRHMSRKQAAACADAKELTSAREISDAYGLPFEITAKTLQRLKDSGLIHSAHGAKGGYVLDRPLTQISLVEFLEVMEGPQSIVMCTGGASAAAPGLGHEAGPECGYDGRCEIKHLMGRLNARVVSFLSGIQLAELTTDGHSIESPTAKPSLEKEVRHL